ncbi:DMT family transporter [Lacisediminihabitans profunda]|uniref:DMT family transporter n=2 Tax=Lacisediminihabitans profunda TaxID=2594790 RepID=A0A5C8UJW9_9MICO|nr:DMT family transporter [Lacisediminihabitans profunda]
MGLIWGSSFLFMKVALRGISFGQLAWSREILGAITLGIVMIVLRQRLPRDRVVWLHFVVIALTNAVIPHLLFAWAEQYVSSSLGSIYNSLTPIATALMATLVFRVERLAAGQVAGVVAGILGVLLIIGPWRYAALTGNLAGQIACLIAATSYGFAIGYLRKFVSHRPIPGTTVAFMNVGTSAAIMLLLTPFLAIGPVRLDPLIVLCVLLLGALGTGVAYLWSVNVLRAWGPTGQSTVTYVIPVVGVVLGVAVLGESLSWNEPVGAAIVLAGILLAQGRILRPRRQPAVLPVSPDLGVADGP